MSHASGAAFAEQEERAFYPSFLRYDAPNVVPGLVTRGCARNRIGDGDGGDNDAATSWTEIQLLEKGSEQLCTSIPATKLAAAKNTARSNYLASQASLPVSCASPSTSSVRNGVSRQDPAYRLPTPPVAGRRRNGGVTPAAGHRRANHNAAGGADANRKLLGQGAVNKTTTAAAATGATPTAAAAAAPVTTSPSSSSSSNIHNESSSQHGQRQLASQKDVLASLMRSAAKPGSFVAEILNGLFPPRMEVVDIDGDMQDKEVGNICHPAINVNGAQTNLWLDDSAATATSFVGGDAVGGVVKPISVQTVSRAPVTREEVALLHDAMQQRLQDRRAKPTGLCPIRRDIYDDVFREVIRQVTIEEPARGVVLQRIKAEADRTREVHADLLAHGHFFAARKVLAMRTGNGVQRTLGDSMHALEVKLASLRRDKAALEERQRDLLLARDTLECKIDEARLAANKVHQDEVAYWGRANQQLSLRLKIETERTSSTSAMEDGNSNKAAGGDGSAGAAAAVDGLSAPVSA